MSAVDEYLPFGLTSDSLLVLLLSFLAFTVVTGCLDCSYREKSS